jgi:hypothetical protein
MGADMKREEIYSVAGAVGGLAGVGAATIATLLVIPDLIGVAAAVVMLSAIVSLMGARVELSSRSSVGLSDHPASHQVEEHAVV